MKLPSHLIVPLMFGLLVVGLGLGLQTIFARSPSTHSNLLPVLDGGYIRTKQALIDGTVEMAYSPPGLAQLSVGAKDLISFGRNAPISIAPGQDVFVANKCASCHGLEGEGGVFAPPIAGFGMEYLIKKTKTGPRGMPAFPLLTQAQLNSIETYLKWVVDNASTNATPNVSATSVPTPTQSAVRPSMPVATPTLSTSGSDLLTKGKLIFEKTAGGVGCAHCHGLDGKGRGPAGIQAANIRSKNEGDIRAAIQGGVPMMSFIKLSDDEITAVAAYLQHLATQPERTR